MSIIKNTEELNNLLDAVQKLPVKKDEQEKVVDITENGTTVVTPDEGMTLGGVTVNVEVESGGGDLPDWDDDSPIIASGRSYYTNNITWELTEKGTFRWKLIDANASGSTAFRAGLGGSALSNVPLEYQAIAPKIKQMYAEDGIKELEFVYAINCERIRVPTTLTKKPALLYLPRLKVADFSSDLFNTLADYQCNQYNGLEKVMLSPLLTTVPLRAFTQCYSLKDINVENVTTFNNNCFMEDFSLNSDIMFNANLISIGTQAFYRTRIKSIKYQNSADNLPTIASNAFGQCRELKAIFCPWAEGAVANANGGATDATMYYNVTYDENGNPIDENGNLIVLEV